MKLTARGSDDRGEYVDRITFTKIRSKSFVWRLDRSYDNGQTWDEDFMVTEARRKK